MLAQTAGIYLAFGLLFTKHAVVDFLFQPPWMFLNKGNLRHPGGYVHAGFHAVVTWVIFMGLAALGYGVVSLLAAGLALAEFVVHYAVDYAKVNISSYHGWKSNTHNEFWYAIGIDQLLHYLTYLLLVMVWFA